MIIFKQCQINSATKHQIKIEINLVSIVYTKLTPFNSNLDQFFQNIYEDAPARLTICYLADPLDQTSTNYISFVSSRAELNALEFLMNFFSKQRKAEIKMPIRSSSRLIQEAKENITEIIDLNHEKNKNVNIPNAKRINSLPSHSFTSKFKLYGKSKIFDLVNITMIRKNLCLRMRSHCWKLVYALSKDGCSYQTLFDATKNGAPCILAILTSNNEIIGAFLPDGIKKNVINSGESFVFNFYTSKKGDENNFAWKTKKKSNVYKWSMKNDLIFSASSKDIMIGGSGLNSSISMKCHNGDPSPCGKLGAAIWIDNVMKNGFTEQCPTFDSPPLIDGGYFTIADIEVWDIVPH
ncbi:hypothetical protein TRFO_33397 [Tritrichomonas foetus]|uniref:Oxidation resistance protein 1 n=1 Tax=Tritrichomonas foetus TaxID=1144522 RepID=A0A1J4JLM7_9EUKA|nr:hypothetical protein TRFO_33397 [Tritrichomonas foetus]|eukprot:OHT00017.1 hypothetical protein TRFO_33397 [Tritrichomonas foetus]